MRYGGVVSVVKSMEVPEFRGCKYPAKAVVESGSEPSVGGSSVPANPAMSITKNETGKWPEVSLLLTKPKPLPFSSSNTDKRYVLKLPTFSPGKCHCELKIKTGLLPFSAAQRKSQRGFRTSCQRGDPWGRGFQAVLYM